MEYDRYQDHSKLFILGLVCLLLSLSLFIFALYIFPFLILGWNYKVPTFISMWHASLVDNYAFSVRVASWVLFLVFMIPALICCYVSYYASNSIDNHLYHVVPEKVTVKAEVKRDIRDTLRLSLQVLGLMILVLVVIAFLQWVLAIV